MVIAPDYNYQASDQRRIIAASINTVVWVIGLLILKWDTYQVHMLFFVDMMLYVFFGFWRVIFSLDGDRFWKSFFSRLMFGLVTASLSALMICVFSGFSGLGANPEDAISFASNNGNNWTYTILIINYSGLFFHDFIYSGKYKIASVAVEGLTDFISVCVLGLVMGLILNFSPDSGHAYWVFSAIGIVIGRFVMELFLIMKTKTILKNTDE